MKLPLPSLLKDVAHGSQVLVIRCEEPPRRAARPRARGGGRDPGSRKSSIAAASSPLGRLRSAVVALVLRGEERG